MGFSNKILTVELASLLGGSMGTILDPDSIVLIARDYRRDSRALKRAFSGGLMASGTEVIDLRATPTSVLQFSIRRFGADAGVMFTRSHNLAGMVSIRLFDSTGIEFAGKTTYKMINLAENREIRWADPLKIGWLSVADAMTIYSRAVAGFFGENKNDLEKAQLRVVIDCGCGPASHILPDLLSEFGCEVITLNAHRPRNPLFLPNPQSLYRLKETVQATEADLGVALDAEARHAIFVDSQGQIRTPEETASINLNSRYKSSPHATVVIGNTVHPSVYQNLQNKKIFVGHEEPGEAARAVLEHRAIYGFNDTGLNILPVFSPGSDAIVAALSIMAEMARTSLTSIELFNDHQVSFQRKEKIAFPLIKMLSFFRAVLNQPPEGFICVDTFLGIKLITQGKEWIHLYLAEGLDMLQLEVHDPMDDHGRKGELMDLAHEIIADHLKG
jgi:phosphomannomutase